MALDAGRRFTEAASESIRAERSEAVNRSLVSFSDRYGAFAVRCVPRIGGSWHVGLRK